MNILVTGGAKGLGAAIVKKLAVSGKDKIYFTYFKSEKQAHAITDQHANTAAFRCDYASAISVAELLLKIPALEIDVLINNAYTKLEKEHFHKAEPEKFQSSFEENVLPAIRVTQATLGTFRKKKFGKIINILSAACINKPPVGWSDYVANKNYILSLSRSWATENIRFNITSNCISPSFMKTDFTGDTDERIIEQITDSHPLKKLLEVEEVAEAVYFLSTCSQQINGINLVINAGADML